MMMIYHGGIHNHATLVVLSMLTMLMYAPFLTKVTPSFCDVGLIYLAMLFSPNKYYHLIHPILLLYVQFQF